MADVDSGSVALKGHAPVQTCQWTGLAGSRIYGTTHSPGSRHELAV